MPLSKAKMAKNTGSRKAILVHNEVRQHTSKGPGSFLLGEGGDVGFLLFPVCSSVFSLCSNQDLNGFPTLSHILCPKFYSLWPSSKAEDYNISILGCPKLDFFGDGPITKEKYWTLDPHYQLIRVNIYTYLLPTLLKRGISSGHVWWQPVLGIEIAWSQWDGCTCSQEGSSFFLGDRGGEGGRVCMDGIF